MKTNLKQLLQTVGNAVETLAQDRIVEKDAGHAALIGHTISGLHGIEGNLRGLLGDEAPTIARKTPDPIPKTPDAIPKTP